MTQNLTVDSRGFALDLHAFLKDIDPARWRADLETHTRTRLGLLESKLEELLGALSEKLTRATDKSSKDEPFVALEEGLSKLAGVIRESPSQTLEGRDFKQQWSDYRGRLQASYEELAANLRLLEIHVPSLRPTNYSRNVFHILSALGVMLLLEVLLPQAWLFPVALVCTLLAWSMETSRRFSPFINTLLMKLFKPVAHPHEYHRVNSATWYTSALLILSLTNSLLLCAVPVIVLGFADPAAALIGRPFGRTKLWNGRSLEGSTAFVIAGTLATLVLLAIFHTDVTWPTNLAIAFSASLIGGIAELCSSKVDDNMTIPLSACLGAYLAALACGLPL